MDVKDCKIIAEIGCSHAGSLSRAIKLINLAAMSGADIVKLQKRNPHVSTPDHLKHKPHPNPSFSYGATYLDHRINLELSLDDHKIIKDTTSALNILYGCSVWDMDSAKEIISIKPDLLKIPSACNRNFDLINYCIDNYGSFVHISLGMTNISDREDIFNKLYKNKDKIIFYHCVSEYPCPFERMQMLGIKDIVDADFRCGFSNHGYGIALDVAAYVMGVEFIERHFIDDRTFRHTDAAASLEPEGLRKLKRDIIAVRASMTPRANMTEEEEQQYLKLKGNDKQ
jgi:sialic acid synthase